MQTRPSAKPSLICKVSNLLWTFSCTWCQDVGFTLCTPACLKKRSCCSEVSAQNQQSGAKKKSGGPITGPRKCKNDDGATAPWRFRLSVGSKMRPAKMKFLTIVGFVLQNDANSFSHLFGFAGWSSFRAAPVFAKRSSEFISHLHWVLWTDDQSFGLAFRFQASKVVRDSLQQKMSLA